MTDGRVTYECVFTCSRCDTSSLGTVFEGQTIKCPGCGVMFTAKIALPNADDRELLAREGVTPG